MSDPRLPPASSPPQTDKVVKSSQPGGEVIERQPVIVPYAVDEATLVGPPPSSGEGVPRHVIGGYVVLKKIGEGGMGSVYLADDPKLGRRVALKTMKPALATDKANRDRFEREARAAAAVEHDNIVPIWGVGEAADGSAFIAMPFLLGEMLEARLKRQPVVGLSLLLKVAREVADGLAAAHAKGLIHRDIKPGNIWLEGDLGSTDLAQQIRRCKILDFGLVRSVDADDAHLTASGAILGTPAYMAPEQARAEKIDPRADLFSLGVMLYRMATGKMPFEGATLMAALVALTTNTPLPSGQLNPDLPPVLTALIDRLMCKDPADRPQSAAEVSAAIRRIGKDLRVRKLTDSAAVPAKSRAVAAVEAEETMEYREPVAKRGRTPWLLAGAVVAALAAVALAVVVLRVETGKGAPAVETSDKEVEACVKDDKPVPNGKAPEPPAAADPDRSAAEWVLSVGGTVRVNGGEVQDEIKAADQLPRPAFRLTGFRLVGTPKVTDEALAVFKDCKHLAHLYLFEAPVTPTGLAVFKDSKSLTALVVSGSMVTDEGMAPFQGCTNLTYLQLTSTQLTDVGLAHFKDCKKLNQLVLRVTAVTNEGLAVFKHCENLSILQMDLTHFTDAGVAHFGDCKKLSMLGLSGTGVTDVGLAYFKDHTLSFLNVSSTAVTNAGLAYFKDCKSLTYLDAGDTKVTDAGLAHLAGLDKLTRLNLARTKVTAKGAEELAKALPGCKIVLHGRAIEPTRK